MSQIGTQTRPNFFFTFRNFSDFLKKKGKKQSILGLFFLKFSYFVPYGRKSSIKKFGSENDLKSSKINFYEISSKFEASTSKRGGGPPSSFEIFDFRGHVLKWANFFLWNVFSFINKATIIDNNFYEQKNSWKSFKIFFWNINSSGEHKTVYLHFFTVFT